LTRADDGCVETSLCGVVMRGDATQVRELARFDAANSRLSETVELHRTDVSTREDFTFAVRFERYAL
jgi:hypothetical protein